MDEKPKRKIQLPPALHLPSRHHPLMLPIHRVSLCLPVIIGAMSMKNDLPLIITIQPFHRPILFIQSVLLDEIQATHFFLE